MTFHSGGDCWEILRAAGSGGEEVTGYFEVLPSLA